MKWVAFYGMALVGVPALIGLCQLSARARRILFALLVFTTCMKISVNFASHEHYRGPDRGFEVTATDLLAASLGVSLLLRRAGRVRWAPPTTFPMALFFVAACVSVGGCSIPLFGWFSLFKLIKAYWLYWVAYNTWILEPPEQEFWWGLVGVAGFETAICLKQKYLHGVYRVWGTFDHSNSIPLYLIMFTPLLLAWLLHGKHLNRWKTAAAGVAIAGCCISVLATQSRAGIVLIGFSVVAVLIRLVPHQLNRRKLVVATAFLAIGGAGLAKAAPTIIRRFQEAPKSSKQARSEFNNAAKAMAGDYVFGVGYNLFSHTMTNVPEYKGFAEVMGHEKHAGVCHHIYYLTAAETGWFGLGCFLLVMGSIHWRLMRQCLGPPDFNHSMVIGVFIGLSMVHLIGLLEWCFRLSAHTNMFMLMAAMGQAYCHHIATGRKHVRQTARTAARGAANARGASPGFDGRSPSPA